LLMLNGDYLDDVVFMHSPQISTLLTLTKFNYSRATIYVKTH